MGISLGASIGTSGGNPVKSFVWSLKVALPLELHVYRRKRVIVAQDIESIFLSYSKGKPMKKMKGKNIEKQKSVFYTIYG